MISKTINIQPDNNQLNLSHHSQFNKKSSIPLKKICYSKKLSIIQDKNINYNDPYILKLIELTTFELPINEKKELKVKLYDTIEYVENNENQVWLGW